MICDHCGEKEAHVHMTRISGGEKQELHLCQKCAEKSDQLGISSDVFSFPKMLSGILSKSQSGSKQMAKSEQLSCANCGLSYQEFTERGLFGCSQCYDSFADNLDYIVQKVQGSKAHSGKVPRDKFPDHQLTLKIKELREELEQMVREEKYERAAELRDEIKEIEERLADSDGE